MGVQAATAAVYVYVCVCVCVGKGGKVAETNRVRHRRSVARTVIRGLANRAVGAPRKH